MNDNLGKSIRLNHLFKDGRMVAIMMDHSIARGILPGLVDIKQTIKKVKDGNPDAISILKGIADKCFDPQPNDQTALIIKASNPSPYNKHYAAIIGSVEDALKCGADAIAVGCVIGGAQQAKGLEQAAKITSEAAAWGLPVIGHFYPRGEFISEDEQENWENVAYAARVGAEIGVDIMKIHHSGKIDELEKIVKAVPTKVVLAGGGSGQGIKHYFQMARNICDVGGAGVAFGRAVWNFEDPVAFIKALKLIVHENASVQEAIEFLEETLGKRLA